MKLLSILAAVGLVAGQAAFAGVPDDAPERPADRPDRMICKRFTETGSLAKRYRTCKTKADWERGRAENQSDPSQIDSCRNRGIGLACP